MSVLYAVILTFFSLQVYSHPEMPTNTINGNYSQQSNSGGYGFLYPEKEGSEAEAGQILEMSCTEENITSYIGSYCRIGTRLPIPGDNLKNLLNIQQNILLEKVRVKMLEYLGTSILINNSLISRIPLDKEEEEIGDLILEDEFDLVNDEMRLVNLTAAEEALGERVIPSCLRSGDTYNVLVNGFVSDDIPSENSHEIIFPDGDNIISDKVEYIQDSQSRREVIRALVWDDVLKKNEDNLCGNLLISQRNYARCDSIKYQRFRLGNAYPILWDQFQESTNDDSINRPKTEAQFTSAFRQTIDLLLKGNSETSAYNDRIEDPFDYPDLVKEIMDKYDDAKTSNSPLAKDVDDKLQVLQGDLLNKQVEQVKNICNKRLSELAQQSPHVIRQAMIEMSDNERLMAQVVLCNSGFLNTITKPYSCGNVTGNLNSRDGVLVSRANANFPYGGSPREYSLKKDVDGNITIKKTVNLVIPNLSDLPESQKQCLQENVKANFENRFNCQIGSSSGSTSNMELAILPACLDPGAESQPRETQSISCPTPPNIVRDPKVKFDLEIDLKSTAPSGNNNFRIHQCFHANISPRSDQGDCEKVKELHINRCIEAGSYDSCDDDEITNCCTEYVDNRMKENPASLNRANAANLTFNTRIGTWNHEIMHQVLISDEYSNKNYPFSELGEHDSIMKNSRGRDSKIYPRHIEQILRPLECLN